MKCLSVGAIKGKANHRWNLTPKPGTKIRATYELFYSNKGKIIESAMPSHIVDQLRDVYGLDIVCLQNRKWCLVGEWFGTTYVDYLAEEYK